MVNHLACFTLAAENFSSGENVDNLGRGLLRGDFNCRDIFQIVGCTAEESFGCFLCLACFLFAMNELGNLISENLFSLVDSCAFYVAQTMNLFHRHEGQQGHAVLHVAVVDIAPILVEFIRRGFFRIKPESALFGFAHLAAIAGGQKLAGHAEGRLLILTADQLNAAEHVGPLVVAAQLHHAAIIMMQLPEVVGLHNHVVELEEGQALFPAFFEAFSSQHTVNGEVHANLTQQLYIVKVKQPISIVGNDSLALAEVDETAHLLLEAGNVVRDEFRSQHLAHFVLAAGVANHAGAAAKQHDRTVTSSLHMAHHHQRDEVTNMQAVGGRVEANIEGNFFLF